MCRHSVVGEGVKEGMEKRKRKGKHTDGLVDAENQTARFDGGLNGINLHQTRLPHEPLEIIGHTLIVKVDACPDVPLAVFHP